MVLTDYQKAINKASLELCRGNISTTEKAWGAVRQSKEEGE